MGIDPSISCTGWALLDSAKNQYDGGFIACGYIVPKKAGDLTERIIDLADALEARVKECNPGRIVLETPAATGRAMSGQRFKGTALTIPVYGAAVGACIVACSRSNACVMGTPSDDWTKSPDTPRCNRDADKANRVEYVQRVWGITLAAPKSLAGNVADALLIARWGVRRVG